MAVDLGHLFNQYLSEFCKFKSCTHFTQLNGCPDCNKGCNYIFIEEDIDRCIYSKEYLTYCLLKGDDNG
jgi:hypothetical protein